MVTRILLGITLVLSVVSCARQDTGPLVESSREASLEFMQNLKATLVQSMQAGGPVNAVAVCNTAAPLIAQDISQRKGWSIARTSLKVRNPRNAPNDWERKVLIDFESRQSQGEDPASLEYHEIVKQDGKKIFRYMKAIPTAGVCLVCHGEKIEAALGEKIKALYPRDQATGYRVGDIRGAFTITQPVKVVGYLQR